MNDTVMKTATDTAAQISTAASNVSNAAQQVSTTAAQLSNAVTTATPATQTVPADTASHAATVVQTVTDKTMDQAGAHIITTVDGIMESISKAFPEVAGKGFEFYTKYIFAQGLSDLVIGIVLFLTIYLAIKVIKKIYTFMRSEDAKNLSDGASYGNQGWPYVISIVGLIALSVFSVIMFDHAIDDVRSGVIKSIAPEGVVVQEIISNLPTKGTNANTNTNPNGR